MIGQIKVVISRVVLRIRIKSQVTLNVKAREIRRMERKRSLKAKAVRNRGNNIQGINPTIIMLNQVRRRSIL